MALMERTVEKGLDDSQTAASGEATTNGCQRLRILMVSDFFYPNFGGVENHIYHLCQCLLKLGHKVVVMTHAYGTRSGVRYMTGGLKVYYIPWKPFLMQNTLPTLFGTLPILRTILIREDISLVHGHQAFSTICHEALMHARTMGYKAWFAISRDPGEISPRSRSRIGTETNPAQEMEA